MIKRWIALGVILMVSSYLLLLGLGLKTIYAPSSGAVNVVPSYSNNVSSAEARMIARLGLQSSPSNGPTAGALAAPESSKDSSTAANTNALSPGSLAPNLAEIAATPESTTLPPETILENMRTTIRLYGATFGENPVGNNAEITKALMGANPKQAVFLKSDDGNRVNGAGELVDKWGTPYFFHQLSATEMEIRSAGPDRQMYTADDLVTH